MQNTKILSLNQVLEGIQSPNQKMMNQVSHRVNSLNKPIGSLGQLEEMVIRLSGIYQTPFPTIQKKAMIVMCGDHGVCEEVVASAEQEVTLIQTLNIPKGLTGVGAIAKQNNTKIYAVDIGVNADINEPLVINRKLMYGTHNIKKGPAMTRETAIKALEVGIEMAQKAVYEGANCLGTGEMGIGNTTPTTAILSILSGESPFDITGIGANFPEEKLHHKASVIQAAIEINQPDPHDILDIISKVGGLEIIGMAGVMLGGAYLGVPVVIDGYLSTVSALIACHIKPEVKGYLFASHASLEKGAKIASDLLGLRPYLTMDMRLGEGSGAILAFNLLDAACYMNSEMLTFDQAGFDAL